MGVFAGSGIFYPQFQLDKGFWFAILILQLTPVNCYQPPVGKDGLFLLLFFAFSHNQALYFFKIYVFIGPSYQFSRNMVLSRNNYYFLSFLP
jgi:hypothetical protein